MGFAAEDDARLLHPSLPRLANPPGFDEVGCLGIIGPGFGEEVEEGGTRSANMAPFEEGEKAVAEGLVVEGANESPKDAAAGDEAAPANEGPTEKASPKPFEPVDGADLPVGHADPDPLVFEPIGSHSRPETGASPPVLTILVVSASTAMAEAGGARLPLVGRPRRMGEMVSARDGAVGPEGTGPELRMLE